jgi:hypothetical protein
MKKVIKISFLIIAAIVFCNIAQAQQKASDKSFATVLNEVKQKQANRNKMLQQMRQTTPANGSQNNTAIEISNTNAGGATMPQQTTTQAGTNQQTTNNGSSNQSAKIPLRPKKQ